MGVTAVWTAVHYKIPLLFVLANNRSFYNDELHQERMARARNRPVENKWIGQRMSEPEVDLAAMGRAQGAVGFGPVTKPADLAGVLEKAIAEVDAGKVAVVDVRVEPGYTAVMTAGDDARGELICHSGARARAREPGIHNHRRRGKRSARPVVMDSG